MTRVADHLARRGLTPNATILFEIPGSGLVTNPLTGNQVPPVETLEVTAWFGLEKRGRWSVASQIFEGTDLDRIFISGYVLAIAGNPENTSLPPKVWKSNRATMVLRQGDRQVSGTWTPQWEPRSGYEIEPKTGDYLAGFFQLLSYGD